MSSSRCEKPEKVFRVKMSFAHMSMNPNLYVNKTNFHMPHFETEVKDNSERAIAGKLAPYPFAAKGEIN